MGSIKTKRILTSHDESNLKHKNSKVVTNIRMKKTDQILTNRELTQGCSLSSTLFSVFVCAHTPA
jgi:hypothetical protein